MIVYKESASKVDFVCRGHSLAVAARHIVRTTTTPSMAVNIFQTLNSCDYTRLDYTH